MAHYALINSDNIVVNVITGMDEDVVQTDIDGTTVGGSTESWETFYGNKHGLLCKRTSYNTHLNQHKNEGTPFRYNYAGKGYTWDPTKGTDGAFIEPKPNNSWILNPETCGWEAPKPRPVKEGKEYIWLEHILDWYEIETGEVLPGPPV
jgi:hypothetical protein